jgi:protein-tyrosine kinase
VERGVGCSWICTHAAEALAAHNQGTVCLVDANLRSPTQHEHFAVDQLPGLSDCIFESGPIQRFINTTSVPNLWLLTSGSTTGDPHVLLSCDVMKERIAELRSEFDFVLIDTAAGLAYSDAILLSQIVDGTVLALQSNSTRRQTAIRAKENLEAANATILGAVLNKRTFPIPQRIYSKL